MKMHYNSFNEAKLHTLGYKYSVLKDGFVSKDDATIIVNNRQPYIGQIISAQPQHQQHLNNLYQLIQFGAITLRTNPDYNNPDRPNRRKCLCGGSTFTGHQVCRHDVIVDGDNTFVDGRDIYDSENPYGPYTCLKCGAEYDDLNELRYVDVKERKTICKNGELGVGDLVLSTNEDDYAYIVGVVTEIHHHGTPEHETDNDEDDVFVNFTVKEYSSARIEEIEAMFSKLYREPKKYDELPLDEAIMGSSTLIRITGIDESILAGILDSEAKAAEYCSSLEQNTDLAEELVMVLGIAPLEQGVSPAQIIWLASMLPPTKFYMPIEFHENNTSAYGFIKDDYYERHNYNSEAFHGLVLPVLNDILVSNTEYYTTPDNKRVYIGCF